jgi:hypothetical protein
MITATTTGLIGEHIAAASILSMGWRVGMAQQDSVDLLAWNNNTYVRVQVKSASPYEYNKGGYQFQLGSGSKSKKLPSTQLFDMIALVAVDQRRVKYLATEQVQQFTKRCTRRWFEDLENEIDSFNYAIEIIEARNGLVKVS